MSSEVSSPFTKVIGASGQKRPRILGMMELDEVHAETSKITFGKTPLTLMQKGSIRSAVRVCRLVAGTEKSSHTFNVEGRLERAEK